MENALKMLNIHCRKIFQYYLQSPADFLWICQQQTSQIVRGKYMYWVYFVTNEYCEQYFTSRPGSATTLQEPEPSEQFQLSSGNEREQKFIVNLTKEDLEKAGYEIRKKVWTQSEDDQLLYLRDQNRLDWTEIAEKLEGRNSKMCYSRYRRLQSRTKNVWTQAQDSRLIKLVQEKGEDWADMLEYFRNRTIKQIKQRYKNYLHPDISKERWSLDQDYKLVNLINQYGLQWKTIESLFVGRTQNQLKNRYFGRLKRISDKKNLQIAIQSQENEGNAKKLQ